MSRKIEVLLTVLLALNLGLYSAGKTCLVQSFTVNERSPLIRDISFIDLKNYNERTPPSRLVLGVDIKGDALYKFSDSEFIPS